eukprot:GHVR01106502.1.p1 GENE.GHVR01106502.1~~GHVR01106502.1.p1  ORF type:complete len:120 (+),score=10.62 GHVR01106502.1:743-1102(+)
MKFCCSWRLSHTTLLRYEMLDLIGVDNSKIYTIDLREGRNQCVFWMEDYFKEQYQKYKYRTRPAGKVQGVVEVDEATMFTPAELQKDVGIKVRRQNAACNYMEEHVVSEKEYTSEKSLS